MVQHVRIAGQQRRQDLAAALAHADEVGTLMGEWVT
jgi:hypothetical protein